MAGKRSQKITTLILILLLALGVSGVARGGTPGDAGMLSLRLGVGAREAAMGETGVASSQGASALHWNPANNVFADFETELVLQHHRYLGLFNQQAAAVAHRAGQGVVGFMFSGLYSDDIERRGEEPVGVAEGTFRPYDLSLAASYARGIGESFSASVTAKFLYERIDIYSDTGFAFDFFVTHKAVVEGLRFALGVTNVGGKMNLKDEPFKLPTTIRGGVAWTPTGDTFKERLTLTGDVVAPNDTNEKAHVGAEYRLVPEFALRLGTRINYENQGLTAGAGFRAGILGVDYAYGESKVDGFDDGHKFSLNLIW
jgi:hypothetical protein